METLIERIAALEERFERADCRYSAKRKRMQEASNPSHNTRLDALEKIVGINNEVTQHE